MNPGQSDAGNTGMSVYLEPIPKKRGDAKKYVTITVCLFTTLLVLAYCFIHLWEDVYKIDKAQKNATNYCYRKAKELTLSSLFTVVLGLFGLVLGVLFDRLSLVAEEQSHVRERYEGKPTKMIKACFSVIAWSPVIVLLLLTSILFAVIIHITDRPWFDLSYLIYISSGLGIGPFIINMLHLNTESKAYISTLLEKKKLFVAYELAQSYYHKDLQKTLEKFKRTVHTTRHVNLSLSLKRLLLLITLDCVTDDLDKLDDKIYKIPDNDNDLKPFPVYRLTVTQEVQKVFAIQYVKKPLEALKYMKPRNTNEAHGRTTCAEEVKLLYRTLSELLNSSEQQNCLLVPIAESGNFLNGGLVKCIMKVVNYSHHHNVPVPGFVKLTSHDGNQNVTEQHVRLRDSSESDNDRESARDFSESDNDRDSARELIVMETSV